MPAAEPRRSLEELTKLGSEVFERQVKPLLRPEDHGKYVAVDIDTGDYEVDKDDYTAVTQLHDRNPLAEICLFRAGYPTAYRIG